MALYRVRNNMRSSVWLPTRAGFRKLNPKQTRALDLIDANSRRMRARQQSGSLTILPITDTRTGRLSPALPGLHLGVGKRSAALPSLPTITGTPAAGTVGTAYTFTPTLGGGQGPKQVTARGALPAGITLDRSTGALTGTPTAAGSFTITLVVSDLAGSASRTVTITIAAAP